MISPFFKKKDAKDQQQELGSEPLVPKSSPDSGLADSELASAVEESLSSMPFAASKSNLDKKSLDLVFAVEQMIQARQHAEINIYELQDRLTHSNGNIERLTRDLKNLNKVIEEREKSILDLEQKLIEKNLKVDQVIEDYRELQSTLSTEIDDLKSVIDLEQQKYTSLAQTHNEANAEKMKKINEMEERIGRLEVENAHVKQKYDTVRQEKAYLSNMISDFTSRMSVPLSQNKNDRND
jgi:chromosome segregation ATPase